MERKELYSRMALMAFAAALVLALMRWDQLWALVGRVWGVMTPVFLGLAIAFVLDRPCSLFQRCLDRRLGGTRLAGASRPLAVALSYLLLLGAAAAVFAVVLPQLVGNLGRLAANISYYVNQSQGWMDQLAAVLHMERLDLSQVDHALKDLLDQALDLLTGAVPQLVGLTGSIVTAVVNLGVSLVFSVYMLAGKERLLAQCRRALWAYLPRRACRRILEVAALTADTFGRFVTGQVMDACCMGVFTFLGMLIFRFDYPLLVGVLIGVCALVPIVGVYVGAFTSALLLAMIQPVQALWFLVMLVCIQQFEGNVVYPRMVGSSLGLPGIWVLAAVMVGGGLFGFPGMLLGVPVVAVVYTLVKRDLRRRLGEEERP